MFRFFLVVHQPLMANLSTPQLPVFLYILCLCSLNFCRSLLPDCSFPQLGQLVSQLCLFDCALMCVLPFGLWDFPLDRRVIFSSLGFGDFTGFVLTGLLPVNIWCEKRGDNKECWITAGTHFRKAAKQNYLFVESQ